MLRPAAATKVALGALVCVALSASASITPDRAVDSTVPAPALLEHRPDLVPGLVQRRADQRRHETRAGEDEKRSGRKHLAAGGRQGQLLIAKAKF